MADLVRLFNFEALEDTPILGANVDDELDQLIARVNDQPEEGMATGSSGLAKGSFHAYRDASYTGLTHTTTLIFDTEEWDLSGWYNTTTGAYIPLLAGIYRLSVTLGFLNLAAGHYVSCELFKNGVVHRRGDITENTVAGVATVNGSWLVEANGVDDDFAVKVITSDAAVDARHGGGSPAEDFFFEGELVGRV